VSTTEAAKHERTIPVRLLARLDDSLFAPDSLEEEQWPWYRRGAIASASPATIGGSVPIGGRPFGSWQVFFVNYLLSYCRHHLRSFDFAFQLMHSLHGSVSFMKASDLPASTVLGMSFG